MKPTATRTRPQTAVLRTKLTIPLIVLVYGLVVSASHATLIAYEGFDYTNGTSLFLQNGGTGWSSDWPNDPSTGGATVTTTNGSMTYTGITPTGGKLAVIGDGGTATDSISTLRTLSTPLSSGTVYFSILAENLNDSLRYFGLALYSGGTETTLLGQGTGVPNWTINKVDVGGPLPGTLISSVDSSASALLVLKLEFDAGTGGTNELLTFWVNPDLSQAENSVTPEGGSSVSSSVDFGTIDGVRIQGGGYSATYGARADFNMDEITIRTDTPFASVPEPAVAVLICIFGPMLMIYRRRKRRKLLFR